MKPFYPPPPHIFNIMRIFYFFNTLQTILRTHLVLLPNKS